MPPVSVTLTFDTREEAVAFLIGNPVAAAAVTPADAPAAPKAAPRTRKGPEAAPAPVAAPVAAPAPTAAAAAVPDEAGLKKTAIAALVKLINANDALGRNGKQVCTDLCLKFGGANVSKIDPSKYSTLIAEVEKELEALNSDPTA